MTYTWQEHLDAHRSTLSLRITLIWICSLILISSLHSFAMASDSRLFAGITARLYLLPVVYAAILGGLLAGFASSISASGSLVLIMLFHSELNGHDSNLNDWNLILTEHLIEVPFFIILGLLIGFFRDHLEHEKTKRKMINELFSRFVSQAVVTEILENGAVLEGVKTEATVMFADIRGFTTLSEDMESSEVVRLLNLFFGEMVEIILSEQGLVDKFIGDCIMSVWGVPIKSSDHALKAVRSALLMIKRLNDLNEKRFFGDIQIQMGIGIHTGHLVAGHVGCLQRMEYTVMGDTVNVASRLQSLTKEYAVPILFSEATKNMIKDKDIFNFRELEAVSLRGRTNPLKIFSLQLFD